MTDVRPALQPASTSSSCNDGEQFSSSADHEVEQMISEKLMKGYVLCSTGCPMCSTPLVKNQTEQKASSTSLKNTSLSDQTNRFPIIVNSESFEQPFVPVIGVPFCVVCQAHVVTSELDVDALENSESFKDKGSILVAMGDDEERRDLLDDDVLNVSNDANDANPAADEHSDDGSSSFTKSLSSIIKESESILGRPVDPNRFTTALFCGTTASRQVVSPSPVNDVVVDKEQLSDPYNDVGENEVECEDNAFADALEEEGEELEEPEHGRYSPIDEVKAQSDDDHGGSEEESESEWEAKDVEDEDPEEMMVEYSVRREIAAKLLGVKLLEGYTLRDSQCGICGMPMMEFKGAVSCVVCPVLMEKSKSSTSKAAPHSPIQRKTSAIERRWATEASTVAEVEEMRKEEDRRAALMKEEEERRQLEAEAEARRQLEERQLALAAEAEERRRVQEALAAEEQEVLDLQARQAALDHEGEKRMREMATLLREQEERAAMLALAKKTNLPISPVAKESPWNLYSAPTSPRVQAIIAEMEDETYLDEVKTFVEAMRLEDFDDASNLPVESLSPRAALLLRKALYLEEVGAKMSEEEAQFQVARAHADAFGGQDGRSKNVGNTSPRPRTSARLSSPRLDQNSSKKAHSVDASEESQLRQARLYVDAMLMDEVKAAEYALEKEQTKLAEAARLEYEAYVAEEARLAEEERKADELWLLEETRRLELLEEKKMMEEACKNESKFREGDGLRKIASVEVLKQRQIEQSLEEARRLSLVEAAEEARRMEKHAIAQKKEEEKEALLAILDKDAIEKQEAAELAMMRAEIALSHASEFRRESLAVSIAQAEVEVLEETQAILDAEYKQTLEQAAFDVEMERWEILRTEGRSILTRRMMHGWKLNDDFCAGEQCRHSPIVEKDGKVECVVCGGTGNGKDGVYAVKDPQEDDDLAEDVKESFAPSPPKGISRDHGPQAGDDFESKRHLVSQEIGRKMIDGWTLLDLSCPHCVMPLMAEGLGGQETCVICGPVALDDGEMRPEELFQQAVVQEPRVADIIKRQAPKVLENVKGDPPESPIIGYRRAESPRSDPPAFFGDDYLSPSSLAPAFSAPGHDVGSFVPEGVGVDDDLMSVALAARADSKAIKTDRNQFGIVEFPADVPDDVDMDDDLLSVVMATHDDKRMGADADHRFGTVEFSTDVGADDLSYMTGTTANNSTWRASGVKATLPGHAKGNSISGVRVDTNHTATPTKLGAGKLAAFLSSAGTATNASSSRLPPRPGSSSQRPPMTPDSSRAKKGIETSSLSNERRGPPRPEEGGDRRTKTTSSPKAVTSPKALLPPTAGAFPRKKSLSVALAELRDRDDESRAESRAETVATEALDAILDRIGECRSVLTKSTDISQQKEMASLIEQLASAAVAVKKMEEMGVY